ncbi:MAG: response regulator [Saprospiraceae bacterium]|nr:response regulator [Saprospiraceae bacterium]
MVSSNKARIIVVDDADSVRAIAGYVLQKAGYEVLSLKSGEEALQYFGQPMDYQSTSVQLLLTDVRMSGISGVDLARSLRHQSVYQRLPIVMMSSNFNTLSSSDLAQLQLNGLVRKPLNISNLIATIKVALATQRAYQVLF